MQEVRIHKFETHYRLPTGALAERQRLDQVRALVLDTALQLALERAGLPEDGELCIRNLFTPICLRLSGTDASLALDWSVALAHAISRALRDGSSPNIVFYYSRRQALMDLVIRVSRGDVRRIWAWRQLKLWRSSDRSSDRANESQAVLELAHALCAEPAMIVPALRILADEGGLPHIANRLTGREWKALAVAALSAIGAAHLLFEADQAPSSRDLRDALRVLNGSRLLRAITSTCALLEASAEARRAVAALAVMDAEPILLRTEGAQIVIGVIAEATRSAHVETLNVIDATDAAIRSAPVEPTNALPEQLTSDHSTSTEQSQLHAPGLAERTASTEQSQLRPPGLAERKREAEFEDADAVIEPAEEEAKPVDLRRRAFTSFAGLLFLLGVIEDLCLPEEIIAHAALGARALLWVTHQLALALLTIEPNDPAAMAFAGLPPDARPPSEEQEAPTEIESRATDAFAARIVERLGVLLDLEDASQTGLLEFVCCRRAEIVADPGWIEVRFSIDDVATEIRRAGLDLDPGYLPWLGVVVRFVYE